MAGVRDRAIPLQIEMMRRGGNSKLREWFSERGVPNNMRISAKYHTPDAE